MSSLGSPSTLFLAKKKAYEVERSLRFNSADDAYLTRTPSSTGNQKVWTWSAWFKRTNLGTTGYLFASNESNGSGDGIAALYFQSDQIYTYYDTSGSNTYGAVNSRKYRDIGAWYHIVWQVDAANTTHRIWINGVEETGLSNNPIDYNYTMNQSGYTNVIGATPWNTSNTSDLYLAEVHFSDGYKYAASDFAETNLLTGQWMPKKFDGSYGTNGFYLNFSDNSGTTATTLGKDSSGNGNNWTPNNFSVSAGAGNDSLEDSPTNNFATLNPLSLTNSGGTFSNGNLDFTADSNYSTRSGTFSIKNGKWYWEITVTNYGGDQLHGIVYGTNPDGDFYPGSDANRDVFGIGWYGEASGGGVLYGAVPDGSNTGQTISAGTSALSSYTTNDVLGFASDIPNGTLAFYKNGTLLYTLTGIGSHDWVPVVNGYGTSSTSTINFGQRPFTHTQPSGFKKLCSANLPDPTILLPNKHFDTLLYTGNGSTQSITGLNFEPDWVWTKPRSQAYGHGLFDSVRGGNQRLDSGSSQEDRTSEGNISFESDGFNVTSSHSTVNQNASTMAAWTWNAGDTDGKTYTVTVVSDSGNKYRFDGFGTSAVTLDLAEGGTYIFNYPSAHPFRFSETADGTHGGGSEYTTGVTVLSSTSIQIVVAASAPNLNYYCSSHSGMGGAINTNSTLGSSNFDGAIQSTVRVNASVGLSIITFTGTGSNTTVGHGLGVTPQAFILKGRNFTDHWRVYHQGIGTSVSDSNRKALKLNETGSYQTSTSYWNDTSPTSTTVSLGTDQSVNKNTGTFVMYCFSEVAGYSKFGSYEGNQNADGPFVFLGFTPAWIMIKNADNGSSRNWCIIDATRTTFNKSASAEVLFANASQSESVANNDYGQFASKPAVDILSNGFKVREGETSAYTQLNRSNTHIFFAFAKSPFKNARAR